MGVINMALSTAAASIGAEYSGDDTEFRGCSTDSRTIQGGELFIAIKGERFDGHDFILNAEGRGACAAMIENDANTRLPVLLVRNTRQAMGRLAQQWRNNFAIPAIAVTGSNGKTTVKEMLVSILSRQAPVLATQGNLNNDIGVPLTLFGLGGDHRYAVIEMGANHPGEIKWLGRITRPKIAVITQCAPAHLEGFGNIGGVANAKAEIYEELQPGGIAVINADDDYAELWRNKARYFRQISFGLDQEEVEVTAHSIIHCDNTGRNSFVLRTPAGEIRIGLALPGQHNIMNALAAASCAYGLDISLDVIRQGLEDSKPVKGRLEIKTGVNRSTIIDDTYNANPVSLDAALKAIMPMHGRHWLVLGDMGELGEEGERLHAEAGEIARRSGIERLFATGPLSRAAVNAFGRGARHFADMELLIATLHTEIAAGVAVLVKGSRSMHMERVVSRLEVKNSC
jgi:UDP-N-acetylmuramoyl-tripeptide--D-alanyl-D-alanine ligase